MRHEDIKFNIYATIGDGPRKLLASDYVVYRLIIDTVDLINDYIKTMHDFYFDVINHISRDEIILVKVDDSGINVLGSWDKWELRFDPKRKGVVESFIDTINEKSRGAIILELEIENEQ